MMMIIIKTNILVRMIIADTLIIPIHFEMLARTPASTIYIHRSVARCLFHTDTTRQPSDGWTVFARMLYRIYKWE